MTQLKRVVLPFLLACSFLSAAGCGGAASVAPDSPEAAEASSEDKPVVAVTIVPEQTFVEAVCGDLVEVVTLVPPGNSLENYEPTPAVMMKFSEASVYFTIGVPTEAANILPDTENIKVVSLQDAAAAVYPERTFESGERDPHIWLSPKRVEEMIKVIAKEMCAVDPGNTDAYNSNADDYIEQLDSLDQYIKNELSGVHDGKFIVYHPAFGYFADDYGLTMYALEEEGKEATPQHLQDIIDLAVEENIKVVFYQDEIDSRQSEAFAEEIGGNTMELSPLAADYIINLKSMADLIAETVK